MPDRKLIVLLLLICTTLNVDSLSISSVPSHLRSNNLMVDTGFRSSLSFGSCDKIHHSSSNFLCKIYVETNEPADSSRHLRFCKVSTSKEANREIVTLDENKVLLISKYPSGSFSLLIVNLPDCKTVPIKIDSNLKADKLKVVSGPAEGLFDVLLIGENGNCSKINRCGMTFDFNGQVHTKLEDWIDDRIHILDYMYKSYGGRLVVDYAGKKGNHKLRVLSLDKYGFIEVLNEYPLVKTPGLRSLASLSMTYQLLTACTRNYTTFTCGQFNSLGKRTLDAMFQLYFDQLHSVRLHNLPYGGFLMLIAECKNRNDDCSESNDDFYVLKIDDEGNVANTLEITEYRCNYGLELNKTRFFVGKRGEYCLSYLCGANDMYARPKLDVICFSNEELDFKESDWDS